MPRHINHKARERLGVASLVDPTACSLMLLLALVACERADLATLPEPQFERPEPEPEPAPPSAIVEPASSSEPAPVEPTPAEPPAPAIRVAPTLAPDARELDRRCMSRAGCRWEGEPKRPRIVKKQPPVVEPAIESSEEAAPR
jgi:hypothetical protein